MGRRLNIRTLLSGLGRFKLRYQPICSGAYYRVARMAVRGIKTPQETFSRSRHDQDEGLQKKGPYGGHRPRTT